MKKLVPFVLCVIALFTVLEVSAMAQINEVSIHDPSIIENNGQYYVFGSHITTAKSTDLINWEYVARGYKTHGNVHFGELSENLKGSFKWAGENDSDCKGGFAVWAPDVYYNPKYLWRDGSRGAYMMYYSASSTYKRSCIGLAVAKEIDGVYEYVDTIIYSGFTKLSATDEGSTHDKIYTNTNLDELIKEGKVTAYKDDWGIEDYNNITYPNAIDPCVYEDETGALYLTYGSWSGGIFVLRLNSFTGLPIYPGSDTVTEDGRLVDRYFGTHIAGGKGWSGEGPFIYYDKETALYYLQTSYDWLGTSGGYHIRMFRSEKPLGPFTDLKGNSAVYGENHAEHGVKMFGNYYWQDIERAYTSGGHCSSLIDKDGERYVFYHTRFKGTEHFQLRVHKMYMNEDGWPVISPYRYAGEEHAAIVTMEEAAGVYEFINHGDKIAAGGDVAQPENITVFPDGRVVGAINGTLTIKEGYITFHTDTVTYKGVFVKGQNEKGEKVLAFTAAGDNLCIWGVKADYKMPPIPQGEDIKLSDLVKVEVKDGKISEAKGKAEEDNMGVYLDGSFGLRVDTIDLTKEFSISFTMTAEELLTYSPILSAAEKFYDNGNEKWFSLTSFDNGKEAVIWSRDASRDYWMEGKKKNLYTIGKPQRLTLVFDHNYMGGFEDAIYVKLYIDGHHVLTGHAAKGALTLDGKLYFGINPWDKCFKGYIDSVRVYKKALTHEEVMSIYKKCSS